MVCDDMQPSCSLPVHVFDQLQHGEQVLSLPRQLGTHSVGLASFFHFSFSAREANIVSNTDYTWRCPDYVPLPSNPVFYQINLPTYMEEECKQLSHFVSFPDSTPYETVINRLETIQLLGVNVIELHALEQSSCDAEYDICWMEPAYSPGLLRPTIGTPNQLKEMIDYIHMMNMSVVLDLNWEFFNINSPIYHYHQFYTLCRL